MTIEDRNRLNYMFDFYSDLLTEKQRRLFELHYQMDLSLGEIGENLDVTRQAVYDLLQRTIAQLNNYERHLHLLDKFQQRQLLLNQLDETLLAGSIPKARELVNKLKNI